MHQIKCPWCGVRDESEFQYQGDASVKRPDPDAGQEAFFDYVYQRDNPKGWHVEWWHHIGGCRGWVKVVRNTVTHEIYATGRPEDDLELPVQDAKEVVK